MSKQRLLLVTLSNIGDLVLTTPVLVAMHEMYPNHLIDIVADVRSSSLLRHCPYLGELHHRDKRAGAIGFVKLVTHLRQQRYEVVVDLRTDFLPWLLRADHRTARWRRPAHGPHAVDQHFAVAGRVISITAPLPEPCVWISEVDRRFADNAFASFNDSRCLILAPGANWPGKIWPLPYFKELISLSVADFDMVTIVGGANDTALAAQLVVDSPLPCLNFTGQTTLTQTAAILDHATAFVGNDSGLGHIAAARKVRTLTLFGPGRPERYRPWGVRSAILEAPSRDLTRLSALTVMDTLKRQLQS
jgi:heptosyltransferase III